MSKAPVAVKEAIKAFYQSEIPGFTVRPPDANEKSLIFEWGARVEYVEEGRTHLGWLCMADEACRSSSDGLILLSAGRTSKATKHLRAVHKITSGKTEAELSKKRVRDDEIERLRSSALYATNPQRLRLLLETLRIVNNNLPLRVGEHHESRVIEALTVHQSMQGSLTTERVSDAIVELYSSAKAEITTYLNESRMDGCANLTLMADFWTCKVTHRKFLGVRVYMVDRDWEFKSVLLGTREFKPKFEDREGGIARPFHSWMQQILDDFELDFSHFYGSTSDAGPDVKALLSTRLKLRWEWCLVHMAHAATKDAFGEDTDSSTSGMVKLLSDMKRTIYQVKTVEKQGDLFETLCTYDTVGRSTKLLNYNAARFLSMTDALRRILDKWSALVDWYQSRAKTARKERKKPPVFLLENSHTTLVQVLSILNPITTVKRMAQAEKCNQVEVLLALYIARMTVLDHEKPVKHYLSTRDNPKWILPGELTEVAQRLQMRLKEALDQRFFHRYFDPAEMRKSSYVFELQLRLHPTYKKPESSLNRIIRLCSRQRGDSMSVAQQNVSIVNDNITTKLRELMMQVVAPMPATDATCAATTHTAFSDELAETFAPRSTTVVPPQNRLRDRVEEELRRWTEDATPLQRVDNVKESILSFWSRMERTGEYRILPKVVRVLFAVPTSSAQIERDFSVSGMMVTTQRARLASHTVAMATFLNRNREFVDPEQCPEIPKSEIPRHRPAHTVIPIEIADDLDFDAAELDTSEIDGIIVDFFSSTSIYED